MYGIESIIFGLACGAFFILFYLVIAYLNQPDQPVSRLGRCILRVPARVEQPLKFDSPCYENEKILLSVHERGISVSGLLKGCEMPFRSYFDIYTVDKHLNKKSHIAAWEKQEVDRGSVYRDEYGNAISKVKKAPVVVTDDYSFENTLFIEMCYDFRKEAFGFHMDSEADKFMICFEKQYRAYFKQEPWGRPHVEEEPELLAIGDICGYGGLMGGDEWFSVSYEEKSKSYWINVSSHPSRHQKYLQYSIILDEEQLNVLLDLLKLAIEWDEKAKAVNLDAQKVLGVYTFSVGTFDLRKYERFKDVSDEILFKCNYGQGKGARCLINTGSVCVNKVQDSGRFMSLHTCDLPNFISLFSRERRESIQQAILDKKNLADTLLV